MSQITVRNGSQASKSVRPSWTHSRPEESAWPGPEYAQLEMLESIRNLLEQIKASQMLQCSVANDIYRMRRAVERIDKRLAETRKLR